MNSGLTTFASGDWIFLFKEQLHQISLMPYVWDPTRDGFGANMSALLGMRTYKNVTSWFLSNIFNLDWFFIEIIIFWLVFFILGFISIYFFVNTFFKKRSLIHFFLGILIYLFNTYILMIIGGGQLGIFLAYATAPLVFSSFAELLESTKNKLIVRKIIIFSLTLAFQILLDSRMAYITVLGLFLYFAFSLLTDTSYRSVKLLKRITISFCGLFILTLLLHFFWFLPSLFSVQSSFIEAIGTIPSIGLVKFFSFSDFSHSFSLLHPNWPENIFGKTYFLQPEFLILPILAYSSLLFIKIKSRNNAEQHAEQRKILFFALLGLVGAFLAKGAKEPFGGIYLWMFDHVPGFILFRDPTKWYLLIALSYSMLIPFSIYSIYSVVNSKIKKYFSLFLVFIVFYLLFLIRPLFLGQLNGTLRVHEVPNEYVKLKVFINNQSGFFRTLWIPRRQRFGFYNNMHPVVSGSDLFKGASASALLKILENKSKENQLQNSFREMGIKYVIVPYDNQGEFFLDDRKYSQKLRNDVELKLDKITWLKKNDNFKDLSVYELKISNDLFWTSGKSQNLSWEMLSPVKYTISVNGIDNFDLTFSQKYDPNWVAKINGQEFASGKIDPYKNVFAISKKGNDVIIVEYKLQQILNYGLIISSSTFIICVILLFKLRRKKP